MFLVTIFKFTGNCQRVRKVFASLSDAEAYCDYHENLGWVIWRVDLCDYSLSDLCEADPA